ncbi:hypothetical protein D9M71_722370 [compost metagenome]
MARIELGDPSLVNVDAADRVADFCQARGLGQTDVAGSENGDLHSAPVCCCPFHAWHPGGPRFQPVGLAPGREGKLTLQV